MADGVLVTAEVEGLIDDTLLEIEIILELCDVRDVVSVDERSVELGVSAEDVVIVEMAVGLGDGVISTVEGDGDGDDEGEGEVDEEVD